MKAIFKVNPRIAQILAFRLMTWASEQDYDVIGIILAEGRYTLSADGKRLIMEMSKEKLYVEYSFYSYYYVKVFMNVRGCYILLKGSSLDIPRKGSLINLMWPDEAIREVLA